MEMHNTNYDKAKEFMIKTDKRRSSYYNYYSNKKWGDSKSYDLCLNSARLGIKGSVELIKSFVKIKDSYN